MEELQDALEERMTIELAPQDLDVPVDDEEADFFRLPEEDEDALLEN